MADKLQIINECLVLTRNNVVNVADDGSDEWLVGSAAYETALRYMLGDHDWKFATQIAALTRVGDSDDEQYADAYAKPVNSLGIVWVRSGQYEIDWKIVGNRILVGAPGQVLTGIAAKYVLEPDESAWPPGFVQALSSFVLSGVYRGLNEDLGAADNAWKAGEAFMAKARTRSDREQRPRAVLRSSILARRRGLLPGAYDT